MCLRLLASPATLRALVFAALQNEIQISLTHLRETECQSRRICGEKGSGKSCTFSGHSFFGFAIAYQPHNFAEQCSFGQQDENAVDRAACDSTYEDLHISVRQAIGEDV